jgi:hypothetical protein
MQNGTESPSTFNQDPPRWTVDHRSCLRYSKTGLAARSQNMIVAIMRHFRTKKIGTAPWLSRVSSVEKALMNKTDDPIPNCHEWSLQDTERKKTKIADIAIGKFRQYWHKENVWCQRPPRPPLQISVSSRIPYQKWIIFWKLSIPHRAFTP